MKRRKLYPGLFIGLLIVVFIGISLLLRIALPYEQVFGGDWIKFTSIDAYYHMRLVDNLVQNYPHLTTFDPFFIFPGGAATRGNFFDLFLATIVWLAGLGSPTQHTVDVVGVYLPPVLAALTVIPVYFIGKALFNKWTGVLAAGLVAVLPGEFLGRTILGFTDHHVAETLFSTVAVLFLILSIKTSGERGLSLSHLKKFDRAVIIRPLVYSLLAGLSLAVYLVTWAGGLLFIFIISLYLVVQFVIDHLRQKSTDYLGITGAVTFLITMVIFLPASQGNFYSASVFIALLIPLCLLLVSRFMRQRRIKPGFYPLAVAGLGAVAVAALYLINASLFGQMVGAFKIFAPAGASATTTMEMQPFLSPQGVFSLSVAWGNFTTGFFISLLALAYFIFFRAIYRRQTDSLDNLFIIWSLVILIATLVQRRFAYYLVINVALLCAYVSWQIIWYAGLRKLTPAPEPQASPVPSSGKAKHKKPAPKKRGTGMYQVNTVLAIIVVFFGFFFFNIDKSVEVASAARFAPSDAWQSSLVWLEENSPEPFGDPGAYNDLYPSVPRGEFDYPDSCYGVTSWWDYGYWITRIARRLPNSNPGQSPEPIKNIAGLFLSTDEASAAELMNKLDSSYIVADYSMSTSKFWAITTWAEHSQNEYTNVYMIPYEGRLVPVQLYYPPYYRSLLVRLYNFDGKAVADGSPMVVSYVEKTDPSGNTYRQVNNIITVDDGEFSNYREAQEFIDSKKSGKYDIVGSNPFISPVPLEALTRYSLVHSSASGEHIQNFGTVPEVKIFAYAP